MGLALCFFFIRIIRRTLNNFHPAAGYRGFLPELPVGRRQSSQVNDWLRGVLALDIPIGNKRFDLSFGLGFPARGQAEALSIDFSLCII
jgi:hypothetical protein